MRNRCGSGKVQIIFQIAAGTYTIGRRSKKADTCGVFLALHQEHAGVGKRALEKRAQEKSEGCKVLLVANEGAIGDAAADAKDRNVTATGLLKKNSPNFGFK